MGGSEYLLQMSSEAPSSFYNLESYVAELNKFKAHREVEHIGQSIAEIAKDLTIPDVHIAAESRPEQMAKHMPFIRMAVLNHCC